MVCSRQCSEGPGLELNPVVFSHNQTIISPSWDQADNNCHTALLRKQCETAGGECITLTEGFYTMSLVWVIIGAVWYVWGFRTLRQFQSLEQTEWRVVDKPVSKETEGEKKFKYFYCF